MTFSLPSFCKVNLWLEILGRRPDGYHELITVFQSLDLADQLHFESSGEGVTLTVGGLAVPAGEDNLVYRAARLVREKAGAQRGVRIHLHKRVPVGAGLGGGSSNAAVSLLGTNYLLGCPLSLSELAQLAQTLGSDVSFFLFGGTALGSGRGERLELLRDLPIPLSFLLVWPGFSVSSRDAYNLLECPEVSELTRHRAGTTIRRFRKGLGQSAWHSLRNDLEEPVMGRFPALRKVKGALVEAGCRQVLLAGSGSVVFAMGDRRLLAGAARSLRDGLLGETFMSRPVSRAEYLDRLGEVGARHFSR